MIQEDKITGKDIVVEDRIVNFWRIVLERNKEHLKALEESVEITKAMIEKAEERKAEAEKNAP